MECNYETLGCYLVCLLGDKFTQQELADKLGVTPQAVNQWLSDKKRPKRETLLKLCLILKGVPENAFKLAGYEIGSFEKSWYVEMQFNEAPIRRAYKHLERQLYYLRQLKKGPNLKLAIEFGNDLREIAGEYSRNEISFLPILFETLDELCHLYIMTEGHEHIVQVLKPIFLEMRNIQMEVSSESYLGMLLGRQADVSHIAGFKDPRNFYVSLSILNKSAKLISEPNRFIHDHLLLTCIDLCHIGSQRQFDRAFDYLQSKILDLGTRIDPQIEQLSYERMAIANAKMSDRFNEERYLRKSKEIFEISKSIYKRNQQYGDSMVAWDLRFERAELQLALSNILDMTEQEKIRRIKDLKNKAVQLGDAKITSQMSRLLECSGSIPDLVD